MTVYGVNFCRLMSQLADVNVQSSAGMFTFCNILHSCGCLFFTVVILCYQTFHF